MNNQKIAKAYIYVNRYTIMIGRVKKKVRSVKQSAARKVKSLRLRFAKKKTKNAAPKRKVANKKRR